MIALNNFLRKKHYLGVPTEFCLLGLLIIYPALSTPSQINGARVQKNSIVFFFGRIFLLSFSWRDSVTGLRRREKVKFEQLAQATT